jgi:hypothetical protein
VLDFIHPSESVHSMRYELSKQLQVLHISRFSPALKDVFENIYNFFNLYIFRTDRSPGRKGRTAFAVRQGIPPTM